MKPADRIIRVLKLEPHPEGGHFRETLRDAPLEKERAHSTAIYFLLKKGERSHWHRVDAAEVWHWYAGGPLELAIATRGKRARRYVLGNALAKGQRPQMVVPRGAWQSARSLGAYTLVGCTVAPGFEYSGFELAPADFAPGDGASGARSRTASRARARSPARKRGRHSPGRD
ncbi:MAG TPA: cupin domain-containing protein [Rhizomicrobium sp.]|jgi:predicted cupin superfamily sugar epimerase